MANISFFRGEETLMEVGYQGESIDKVDVSTVATPTEALAYLQTLTINVNENVMRERHVNGNQGRNVSSDYKGIHEASASMTFRLAKDLSQTDAQEGYFLKMAIDGTTTDTSNVYTIPATADEYGDDYLKVFTLEAGYNKASNVICHNVIGCIVNQETMHCEEGQFVEWTWDILAAGATQKTAFTGGSVAESTEKPFHWGDVAVKIDVAGGTPVAIDGCEMFEHVINNNVTPIRDLANATTTRNVNLWELGNRDISGSIRRRLTTATANGQDIMEIIYGDATGESTPSETITLMDLECYLYIDGTYYVKYTYHNVVFSQIPHDITGEGISKVTMPWTAQAVVLEMKMNAAATEPTGWA